MYQVHKHTHTQIETAIHSVLSKNKNTYMYRGVQNRTVNARYHRWLCCSTWTKRTFVNNSHLIRKVFHLIFRIQITSSLKFRAANGKRTMMLSKDKLISFYVHRAMCSVHCAPYKWCGRCVYNNHAGWLGLHILSVSGVWMFVLWPAHKFVKF